MTTTLRRMRPGRLAVSLLALAALQAMAQNAAKLGTPEFTAAGADPAASPGGIPAWATPDAAMPGWSWGKKRLDYFKYKGDKPLYSIDASNVDKHADKLSPGQIQLIKTVKGFHMDVYPTRRTCGMPDFAAENTKKNVGFAKISADGALQEAYVPGIPFPFPQSGAEAMWNAKVRYRGLGLEMKNYASLVSPRKGSTEWISAVNDLAVYYPWGAAKAGTLFSKVNQVEGMMFFQYASPAALAGQGSVITGYAAQPNEVFYYFPGQRRVRRMPAYSYDAPQIGYENQITVDESYVFSGPLDRFDWKLVGKKEMVIPYNSLALFDFTAKREDVMQPDFIAPSHRRYELHRVWVVEATVKSGMRHVAPKRQFLVDEDSWNLVGATDYDAQGRPFKVREGYIIPVFELGACDTMAYAQYNLPDGRYSVDAEPIGAGVDFHWLTEPGGNPRMKPDFYTADNLRAVSER
ncbi:MAG TPA: DUF1329 domain-containing protein [Piscinibacter sp.]|nr:DUF1329 domain-containing protein [Piscinibacter sp.]